MTTETHETHGVEIVEIEHPEDVDEDVLDLHGEIGGRMGGRGASEGMGREEEDAGDPQRLSKERRDWSGGDEHH